MEKQPKIDFIAIDDDKGSNMITEFTIKKEVPGAEVHTFLDPEKGLRYIENASSNTNNNFVILLDINMPIIDGWDVLDKIGTLNKSILDKLKIFMLSSSDNPLDKKKAENNCLVSGYIEKPFRKNSLEAMLGGMVFEG